MALRSLLIGMLALALVASGCVPRDRGAFAHGRRSTLERGVMPTVKLVRPAGDAFSLEQTRGKWVWLYFGYTNCPDICPTTLGLMADAYRKLKQPGAVQVIFVSVDPHRDTPARLKSHMGFYHPAFLGLTGPKPALDTLTRAVGTSYVIGPATGAADAYTVTHPNTIYILNPESRLVATYDPNVTATDLATDFDRLTS